MIAGAKSLRFLGEGKKLTVPFFQRSYVWKKSNWEELLNSFDNETASPFLGSIILKNITIPLGPEEKMIIDGQQRLTTITILSKAIYDSLPPSEQEESGITDDVKAFLFYKDNTSDKFRQSHVKITHSRIDSEAYEKVLRAGLFDDAGKIDRDTINEQSSKILQCYKYFMEQLSTRSISQLERLHNVMFSSDRNIFVLIELENFDVNEQYIFDTINRAGMHLSTADIIKNNLFKHLLNTAGNEKSKKDAVTNFYEKNWETMFNPDQPTTDLWDSKRRFGNVEHSNLEFLFYCVACINWGEKYKKAIENSAESGSERNNRDLLFNELASVYEWATQSSTYEELFVLVHQILDYARIYKTYILELKCKLEDENTTIYFRYKDYVNRLLLILEKFGIQMFYPYVLKRLYEGLYERGQNGAEEKIKADFHVLESFVVRRKISPKGTHDYTSKCQYIIDNGIGSLISGELCDPDSQISDRDIFDYLHKTEDNAAKMILFLIELYRRRDATQDVEHLEYRYTLEHIMPKKWDTHWTNVPVRDGDSELQPDSDEGKEFRNKAIQQIGNKTLLTGSLNSKIRNSDFIRKVNGELPQMPGYKYHTSLSLTANIVEQAQIDPVWDETHIENRTKELYKEFLTLWPSFSELLPQPATETVDEENSMLSRFTEEQLSDPIKLLDAVSST